jgi:hypothetical protein
MKFERPIAFYKKMNNKMDKDALIIFLIKTTDEKIKYINKDDLHHLLDNIYDYIADNFICTIIENADLLNIFLAHLKTDTEKINNILINLDYKKKYTCIDIILKKKLEISIFLNTIQDKSYYIKHHLELLIINDINISENIFYNILKKEPWKMCFDTLNILEKYKKTNIINYINPIDQTNCLYLLKNCINNESKSNMFIQLINNGVDMNLINKDGLTVLETLNNTNQNLFLMKLLLEHGADYENAKKNIIEKENTVQLEILIKYNCKFTEQDIKLNNRDIIKKMISAHSNNKLKYYKYNEEINKIIKNGNSEEEIKKNLLKINLQIIRDIVQ